jgi:EthD domain-containing protein
MSGTVKRISLVRLRDDLSREACLERWHGEHADIVRELAEVLEYTVDLRRDAREAAGWDAVATLRFADAAALRRFQDDPELQQRLLATREGFAAAVEVFLVDEHRLIPGGAA